MEELTLNYPVRPLGTRTRRELTVAVMGAGSRGFEYTAYGKLFPGTLRVVAVADINAARRDRMGEMWNLPADRRFGDFHELLAAGRLADILLVSLPDDLHFEPAMEAMRQGYDILLEKPMAQTADACRALLRRQHELYVMAERAPEVAPAREQRAGGMPRKIEQRKFLKTLNVHSVASVRSLHTSTHETKPEYASSSGIVSSAALAASPAAG